MKTPLRVKRKVIELKNITPQPGRPLYMVVKDTLRAAIDAGRFQPGDRLPSTKVLSEKLSVSLVTAHRALQELVTSGVLRRGQGKGTYVHEDYGRETRRGLGYRLGIVFHADSSLADAYNGQIFEGVRREANELGIDMVLLRYGEDWRNECNGYLFVNPFEDQLTRPIRPGKRGPGGEDVTSAPIMVVGATFTLPNVMCVDTDNVGLATAAVNYLAELGHRTVAFVGGSGKVSNDRDRHSGFLSACRSAGITVRSECVIRNGGWRMEETERLMLERQLSGPDRPTAVFAAGYHFALDTYSAALNVGLRVPQDLSVIGVDDPPSASFVTPPLTTFRQQMLEMGRAAVRTLFARVQQGAAPARNVSVQLPAEFVERLSCASATATSPGVGLEAPPHSLSHSPRSVLREGRSFKP
ncbi:MAG: GntR family transcriptional regulator [Planctomycetota bacterium]|nr:GntR family transcriptional regulator [Planctomycetota bacterium]